MSCPAPPAALQQLEQTSRDTLGMDPALWDSQLEVAAAVQ